MQPFNFKVIRRDDENAQVPVSVAGQTMVDVQNLLTDMGELMIRREMRLQNGIPTGLMGRFNLCMDLSQGRDVGAVTEGEDTLMLDALNQLIGEFDVANLPEALDQPNNHLEAVARRKIFRDMLALVDHLEGYDFFYGTDSGMKKLRMNRRERFEALAANDSGTYPGAVIGTISQDPVRKHRWVISNGEYDIPISFASNIAVSDIPLFSKAGPLIASGTVVMDADGNVREMKGVNGCYSFPCVKFHRIITSARDIVLLVPAEAVPGYDPVRRMWSLDNADLGIEVSKPTWDQCVIAFHEYFEFLWETYCESDDEFEGEEKEISDLLKSMAVPY